MNWLIYAAVSVCSISIANLFQKLAMKEEDSDPVVSAIIFTLLNSLFTGIFALTQGFRMLPLSLVWPSLVSGILYAAGTVCFFKAIKVIEASLMTILTGFGAIVTIVAAFLFIGERLSAIQIFGAVLILVAIVTVNYQNKSTFRFSRGVVYSLLGTSAYGLAVTTDAYILRTYSAISYTPVISFIPALLLFITNFSKTGYMIKYLKSKLNRNLIIYSLLYSIQAVTYYLALEKGALASQMNTFFKSEIILTMVLATIFLRERKDVGIKIVAAMLTTIGVMLIR